MLQLVNLSNYQTDNELIGGKAEGLQAFLCQHHLDGIEMMLCAPWDAALHPQPLIQGVHLNFWPDWLDFWRGEKALLLRHFGNEDRIIACYGGLDRDAWLNTYRQNIMAAVATKPKYLVFHVSNARSSEVFHWNFAYNSFEVVTAVIEIINELTDCITKDVTLLFENLWWPGLTLQDKTLVALLLEKVKHPKVGIMLDTGHLMNTNAALTTEDEGVDYILRTISNLGEYRAFIKGIHLHRSLSGRYVTARRSKPCRECTPAEVMSHVMKIDEHLPFSTPKVQDIINYVQPEYLVHEFVQNTMEEWGQKIDLQQSALGLVPHNIK